MARARILPCVLWLSLCSAAGVSACAEPAAAPEATSAWREPAPAGPGHEPPPPENPPSEAAPWPVYPAHLPPPPEVPDNPTTRAGFELGRRLFFDRRLSSTGEVSCASCHQPAHAFSVPDAFARRGVSGRELARHAPTLFNLAWAENGLFWDGGAKNLESLSLAPLTHPDEMGHTAGLDSVLTFLERDPHYPVQFAQAFDGEGISLGTLLRALAQFQRGIVSADSAWDRRARGDATEWGESSRAGEQVFARHCARCHSPGLFTDDRFHNNGLDAEFDRDPEGPGRGRERVTHVPSDLGAFKTPSLRNVVLSAPYMHDGRFETLAEVIEHYRHGMRESASLDPGFRRGEGQLPGVEMTDREAEDLRLFLHDLTDVQMANQPMYQDPFSLD